MVASQHETMAQENKTETLYSGKITLFKVLPAINVLVNEWYLVIILIQSTLVISNSKGLSEILRDIRSSTYQVCRIVEKK